MPFDFASAKASLRRVVHDTLGVDATYEDDVVSTPEEVRVRWHPKGDRFGDLIEGGYAEIVESADKIILFTCDTPDIVFKKGGVITLPEVYGSIAVRLDVLEQSDGPSEQVWQVVRA